MHKQKYEIPPLNLKNHTVNKKRSLTTMLKSRLRPYFEQNFFGIKVLCFKDRRDKTRITVLFIARN
jgi:hypothetical protein